jgi:L-ascorbate metabolism protein UlaG (beta-lactamase superfamily)
MELLARLYAIDLALLPIGGVFTMDSQQAALACNLLKCKNVLPMHWGSFPVLEQDTDRFARELKEQGASARLINLEPGQSLELPV